MFAGADWSSVLQIAAIVVLIPVVRRLHLFARLLRLVQRG